MRKFVTSLLAFFVSGFVGGLVAQILAVETGATEEYIVVFLFSALVTIFATAVFFVMQFLGDPAAAVYHAAFWMLALFAVALIGLSGWAWWIAPDHRPDATEISVIAGLILPSAATVLVQWLFVRWRLRDGARPKFGRVVS